MTMNSGDKCQLPTTAATTTNGNDIFVSNGEDESLIPTARHGMFVIIKHGMLALVSPQHILASGTPDFR